jgi:hypothetical protein
MISVCFICLVVVVAVFVVVVSIPYRSPNRILFAEFNIQYSESDEIEAMTKFCATFLISSTTSHDIAISPS